MIWRKAVDRASGEMRAVSGVVPRTLRLPLLLAVALLGAAVYTHFDDVPTTFSASVAIGLVIALIFMLLTALAFFAMLFVHHWLRLHTRIREASFTSGLGAVAGIVLSTLIFVLLMQVPIIGPRLASLLD